MKPKLLNGITNFLQSRLKSDGGYSASPWLPATIEDSYCAFRIISFINKNKGEKNLKNRKKHIKFLISCIASGKAKDPKNFFQTLWCLDFCQYDISQLHPLYINPSNSLTNLYYLSKIKKLFLLRGIEAQHNIKQSTQQNYLFNSWNTLEELWKSLYVKYTLHNSPTLDLRSAKVLSWIKQCQNSDGGFGFLPNTTSYIENCHFALNIIQLLQLPYPSTRINAVKQFALSCRTKSGGFARRPDAAPFMDSTYHATAVLLKF